MMPVNESTMTRAAIHKAGQILDQERMEPTVRYDVPPTTPTVVATITSIVLIEERGKKHPRQVRENPEQFKLRSTNFDLLCTLLDQLPEQGRQALLASLCSRISDERSFHHKPGPVLGAGSWGRCSSELPLLVEFLVRRGDKQLFIRALGEARPSPGLTLLLLQLEEMIALNFTLFTDDEYRQLPTAINGVRRMIVDLQKRPKPNSPIESNTIFHINKEVPELCDSVLEECRKARYLYVKASLLPEMNLEINHDKDRVRSYLEKLGFPPLLTESLDEAERLYRTAATPFELKSSMAHLRSFLEKLHLQACQAVLKKSGGCPPAKWGEAVLCLRNNGVLTLKEDQFATAFYALMSDTTVHPLIAEREYARLMRNVSIEYGLLLLTKLDKLALK